MIERRMGEGRGIFGSWAAGPIGAALGLLFAGAACTGPGGGGGGGGGANCVQFPTAPVCLAADTRVTDTRIDSTTDTASTVPDSTATSPTDVVTIGTETTVATDTGIGTETTPECQPGALPKCSGNDVIVCANGSWQTLETCPDGCVSGACDNGCDCGGRECGSDGCGGSCGTCSGNENCSFDGQCVCQPDCGGRECGSDGCGGSCGSCTGGATCNASGQCTGGSSTTCSDILDCAWDATTCLQYDPGSADYLTCAADCAAGATAAVKSAFTAVDTCETNCGTDGDCVWGTCMDELAKCVFTSAGTQSCPQINTCQLSCADGDQPCLDDCWLQGSRTGQAQLLGLFQCINNMCPGITTTDDPCLLPGGDCSAYYQACPL